MDQTALEKLKTVFPDCVSEGKLNLRKLLSHLGQYDLSETETYKFEWKGKSESLRMAQCPATGILKPCPSESKDWDSTQNLYIEGDNLEVLKLLQKTHYRKVKMIFTDPPYNTGNNFVYKDKFAEPIRKHRYRTRQNLKPESMGHYHTKWLNMMYPRLSLAANLLTEDGVILIHIDENELCNLIKLLNEVFGEENNLGILIWDKRRTKGDAKAIATHHEYILAYAKDQSSYKLHNRLKRLKKNADAILKQADRFLKKYPIELARKEFGKWLSKQNFSSGEKAYRHIDENGDVYRHVSMAWPNKKQAPEKYFIPLIHPKTNKPCPVPQRGWRNPPETMKSLHDQGLILYGVDETSQPQRKYLLKNNRFENVPSLIYYAGSDDAMLKEMNIPFDTPKVVEITKELINSFGLKSGEIIIDLFSGSATTAHAVLQLNADDGGNRKFIMVQLPELTDDKSEAYKAGYKNICEIGKERIRRAGTKITDKWNAEKVKKCNDEIIEQTRPLSPPDTGFKVFKFHNSIL